jgi:hypothetical protein
MIPPRTKSATASSNGGYITDEAEEELVEAGGPRGSIAAGTKKIRTTPDEIAARKGPLTPPPLMLEEMARSEMKPEADKSPSRVRGWGWEFELWRISGTEDSSPSDNDVFPEEKYESGGGHRSLGARMITTFRGGGIEEDVLSFAPGGGGDIGGPMAVDLANFAPVDGNFSINSVTEELALCVLTEAGRLTAYGIPEASKLRREKTAAMEHMTINKQIRSDSVESNFIRPISSRGYRQSTDHRGSEWWNKDEEEDLFGGERNTERDIPKNSSSVVDESMLVAQQLGINPSSTSAVHGVSQMRDDITEESLASSIIPDGDLIQVVENNEIRASATEVAIDPTMASRVPCPPLCGVAFSSVGSLVTFSNGPVKRMWSHYQSNRSIGMLTGPNLSQISFQQQTIKKGDDIMNDDDDASAHDQTAVPQRQGVIKTLLPRTLLDLIEMNLRSQSLQWGDGENEQLGGNVPSDDGGGSSSSGDSTTYEDGELLALESDESSRNSEASEYSKSFFHVAASNDSTQEESTSMFDDYFSSSRKPLLGAACESSNGVFAGLPSLSPSVLITRKHDDILLNGQSPFLANLLKLGDQWWLTKDFTVPHSTWQKDERNASGDEFWHKPPDPPPLPSPVMRSASFSPTPKLSKHTLMMGNLKKLFANQLPSAMTPPDQRLRKFLLQISFITQLEDFLLDINRCSVQQEQEKYCQGRSSKGKSWPWDE